MGNAQTNGDRDERTYSRSPPGAPPQGAPSTARVRAMRLEEDSRTHRRRRRQQTPPLNVRCDDYVTNAPVLPNPLSALLLDESVLNLSSDDSDGGHDEDSVDSPGYPAGLLSSDSNRTGSSPPSTPRRRRRHSPYVGRTKGVGAVLVAGTRSGSSSGGSTTSDREARTQLPPLTRHAATHTDSSTSSHSAVGVSRRRSTRGDHSGGPREPLAPVPPHRRPTPPQPLPPVALTFSEDDEDDEAAQLPALTLPASVRPSRPGAPTHARVVHELRRPPTPRPPGPWDTPEARAVALRHLEETANAPGTPVSSILLRSPHGLDGSLDGSVGSSSLRRPPSASWQVRPRGSCDQAVPFVTLSQFEDSWADAYRRQREAHEQEERERQQERRQARSAVRPKLVPPLSRPAPPAPVSAMCTARMAPAHLPPLDTTVPPPAETHSAPTPQTKRTLLAPLSPLRNSAPGRLPSAATSARQAPQATSPTVHTPHAPAASPPPNRASHRQGAFRSPTTPRTPKPPPRRT